MAVRAIGHDMKVGVVQFVKGSDGDGRESGVRPLSRPDRIQADGRRLYLDTQDRTRDIAVAREAWEEVKRMIADPSYAMVIADELNIVLRYDYLPVDEVLEALECEAAYDACGIFTGRNAPQQLIDAADLVTEMAQVKHPFREQNVKRSGGIEF